MARGPLRYPFGEQRLVSEYLAATYPNELVKERVRLGPLVAVGSGADLTDAELRMMGVFRRFADAVVITKTALILIEGKMRAAPDAVAQLHLYNDLINDTFELYDYRDLPRVLLLVTAIADPAVERLAAKFGVNIAVFRPDWYAEWAIARNRREATPHRDFVESAV